MRLPSGAITPKDETFYKLFYNHNPCLQEQIMDIFGYAFIGIAALSAVIGIFVGFFKSLINAVGFVLSVAVGAICSIFLGKTVAGWIDDNFLVMGYAIAFAVGFFIVLGVFIFVKYLIQRAMNSKKGLRVFDRILGPVINLVICWLVFGAIFGLCGMLTTGSIAELPEFVKTIAQNGAASNILNAVYGAFNPLGFLFSSIK